MRAWSPPLDREAKRDATGVAEARATLRTAYDLIEARLEDVPHPGGAAFTSPTARPAPRCFTRRRPAVRGDASQDRGLFRRADRAARPSRGS